MVKATKSRKWWLSKAKTFFIKIPLWLLSGFLLLALLVGVAFMLPASRGLILSQGLNFANKSLPGELSWQEARWSTLGSLEFENVRWVAPRDNGGGLLADVQRLAVAVDLDALRQKDVRVLKMDLLLKVVDIPTIMSVLGLPVSADTTDASAAATAEPGFPRPGSIPGVPSLTFLDINVTAEKLVLPDNLLVTNFQIKLDAEAGFGKEAQVKLEHLAGNLTVLPVAEASAPFKVDLTRAALQVRWLDESQTVVMDSLSVIIAAAGDDELSASWRTAGPVHLASQGQVSWSQDAIEGDLICDFTLPAGEHLSPLIPEGVPAELVTLVQSPLLGSLTLQGKVENEKLAGRLEMDVEKTLWLDRGLINLSMEVPRNFNIQKIVATLDTLDISLLGTHLLATAAVKEQNLDWRLELAIADASLPTIFAGEALQGAALKFNLQGQGDGTFSDPRLDVIFTGELASPLASVSDFSGHIKGSRKAVDAGVKLVGPIEAGSVLGDSLLVSLNANLANPEALETFFSLNIWAPEIEASVYGMARRDSVQEVRLDSLTIIAAGLEMDIPQPAVFRLGPNVGNFLIENFALEGDPGSVAVNGYWDDSGLNFHSTIDIYMPEEMLQTLVPNPLWSSDGGMDISLKGGLDLSGSPQGPQFKGALQGNLIPHQDSPPLGVGLDFFLEGGSAGIAGLGADFAVAYGDSVLLCGEAHWPGTIDLAQGTWQPAANDSIIVQVPEQLFSLSMLNRMMPPGVALHGDLNFAADASIASPGPEGFQGIINGLIKMQKTRVDLPNRSRVVVGLDLNLEGTIVEPAVTGTIEIHSGFFRIPELPKTLHPTEGSALLWEAVKVDTLAVIKEDLKLWAQAAVADSMLNVKSPAMIPDLDLVVLMPGNLRVHGYGLDVELGGDLKIKRGEDSGGIPMPVITGSVEILEGTLRFMNRMFVSQKGEVHFAGHAPANPILDLQLEADVGSYLIKIAITGQATEPEITLSSEPEMNEVDIMAVLFFGQPANDLDNDQRGHMNEESDPGQQLRENLAGLAMVFGTAGLSNTMSNTLGVDMLEVGSDSSGDSTIMVGKFLTPKIMLKYHQSLAKSGSYYMTLEYSLSRFLKLMSSYGQGDEPSGLELGFTKRY